MLTLPPFTHHQPESVADAVALLAQHPGKTKLIAGGTDLLPNMKHRLFTPEHVIGLKGIPELQQVHDEGAWLAIGSMVTIADTARHPDVQRWFPALAFAAKQIAGPQLREMGTVGGNLCLDTRCVYYNQTYFWRKALGYCLKKDGTVCHVVKSGKNCVAAASNDTAPVLIALGAKVRIASPAGRREMPVEDFFVADGIANTVLTPEELVTQIVVPKPIGRTVSGYQKLRIRAAIDYPALSVAFAAKLDDSGAVEWLKLVVSALAARPHNVKRLETFHGRQLDAAAIAELGQIAHKQCHPLTNINVDPGWRRELVPVLVRKAVAQALGNRTPA